MMMDFSSNWRKLKEELKTENDCKNAEKVKAKTTASSIAAQTRIERKKLKRKHMDNGIRETTTKECPSKRLMTSPKGESGEDDQSEWALSKIVAIDCEYVGAGRDGRDNILARVSIVNQNGRSVYEKYVCPTEKVVDYRTAVSGIRPSCLKNATAFSTVQKEVAQILEGRTVVGHDLQHDFQVLKLSHPRKTTRDTAIYKPFREMTKSKGKPSLKRLAETVLGVQIQRGEHDSCVDARIALQLYLMNKKQWESYINRYQSRK